MCDFGNASSKDMADSFNSDTTSGMPEEEKKKFAAKAVKDFMKDV